MNDSSAYDEMMQELIVQTLCTCAEKLVQFLLYTFIFDSDTLIWRKNTITKWVHDVLACLLSMQFNIGWMDTLWKFVIGIFFKI